MSDDKELKMYGPEMLTVRKQHILDAIDAINVGIDFAREVLITHDSDRGRTTFQNERLAEMYERNIREMERARDALKKEANTQ